MENEVARGSASEQPPPVRGPAWIVQGSPFCPTSHTPLPPPDPSLRTRVTSAPGACVFRLREIPGLLHSGPAASASFLPSQIPGSEPVWLPPGFNGQSPSPRPGRPSRRPRGVPAPGTCSSARAAAGSVASASPPESALGDHCGDRVRRDGAVRSPTLEQLLSPWPGGAAPPASGAHPQGTGRLPRPLLLDLLCFKASGSWETLHTEDTASAPGEAGGVCFQWERAVLIIPQRAIEHGLRGDAGRVCSARPGAASPTGRRE